MKQNPKDLIECIKYYLDVCSPEILDFFRNTKDSRMVHHTTGRAIRNDWGLWNDKNELHEFFVSIGIWHPDDMSAIILESLHRLLNNKPINLTEQVTKYKDYWTKVQVIRN